jgi:hypothetical protein
MNRKRTLAGAILLAMLVLPAIAAPPEGKPASDRDAAIAEKWIAAWNSHNPDKMLPVFTDDVFYEDVAFGESVTAAPNFASSPPPNLKAYLISNSSCCAPMSTAATEPSNGCLVAPIRACSRRGKNSPSEASA